MLNDRYLLYLPPGKEGDVDESMVPYFGKYGGSIKQSIRNKPIRFGYKVWCFNLSDGYLIAFDVYQGKHGQKPAYKDKFGVGGGTVLSLLD